MVCRFFRITESHNSGPIVTRGMVDPLSSQLVLQPGVHRFVEKRRSVSIIERYELPGIY